MRIVFFFLAALILISCTPKQTQSESNVCAIFKQHPQWYVHAKNAEEKWGVPVAVQMAVIYQESKFQANLKDTKNSPFYGYSQAHNETWEVYKKENKVSGDRDEFDATTDFIGWYGKKAKDMDIDTDDPYHFYLVYASGFGSYKDGNYKKNQELQQIAQKVADQAKIYQKQLDTCKLGLQSHWWKFWE
jgi:hypothetical protein